MTLSVFLTVAALCAVLAFAVSAVSDDAGFRATAYKLASLVVVLCGIVWALQALGLP